MSGMAMMLKSLGFDPDEIKRTADGFLQTFNALNERMQRIETNQERILEKLENADGYSERLAKHAQAVKGEGEASGQHDGRET